jgi:hypothetical protein
VINSFEFTSLPQGKVIICVCDQIYFENFFNKLYISFSQNVSEFDQMHVHIINPDISLINNIKSNIKLNVSFSWEGSEQLNELSNQKINIKNLDKCLPAKIKRMLLAESLRGKPYLQFSYDHLMSLGISWRYLISKDYIYKSLPKTYYASRRFALPRILFKNVSHVLFIDIDSIFNKDLKISFNEGSSTKAIRRKEPGWSIFYAGLVFVRMDREGKFFLEKIYNMIQKSIEENEFYWGIDQVCLDKCYEKNLLDSFSKNHMDFAQDSNASFISYKGDKKWK